MLNAGVIGMGVGEKHVLAYQNHDNINLKTICDFDEEIKTELNTKFPDVLIASEDQSILNDKDIAIVSVASYDNYHSSQIIQALENGKHVIAEKPLCLSLDEMLMIYEVQKQNKNLKLIGASFGPEIRIK